EELVLDLLRRHGPLSRSALGTHSGLSRTTLHDIVVALLANGAVVTTQPDVAPGSRGRGRPAETLMLNPDAGHAIGIDFARRAVHVAIVNVAHEVVGSVSEPHRADLDWDDRTALAERLVGDLAGDAVGLGALSAIGVGVVGPVGSPDQEWARAESLDDVARLLRKRFEVPVLLDNNTRLAALAESVWGAAAGGQDVLYLRLSYGVGGGLIVGGSLHRGAYGLSGEFGHITVEPGGAACDCGGAGCLETVASVPAVLEAYRAAGGHADDITDLLAALEAGDATARDLIGSIGSRVGFVLAVLCNAIGPRMIVVGGELAEAGAALLDPIERALSADALPMSRHALSIRRATLGDAGGALGGIALVLHESPLLARYPLEPDSGEPL
ncbi:MAG: ROK family protein, partial [Nocardioidaceae bacterium]